MVKIGISLLVLMLILTVGFSAGVPPAVNKPIISSPAESQTVTTYRYDTIIPIVFTALSTVNSSFSCKLLSLQGGAWGEYNINATTYNATATTLYLNRTIMPDYIFSLSDVEIGVNCTVSAVSNNSAVRTFNLKLDRGMAETVTDLGVGMGSFIGLIKAPMGDFILYLSILSGVIGIFLGIAFVIKRFSGKQ
jgi:hypothetical protein